MSVELWQRPWARYVPARRQTLTAPTAAVPAGQAGPALLYHRRSSSPLVDGRHDTVELVALMREHSTQAAGRQDIETNLSLLPFPVRRQPGFSIAVADGECRLSWPDAPERPRPGDDPDGVDERRARDLMLRAEAVWDRIGDVEDALADPARLWEFLRGRWAGRDAQEPRMDVIVRQAQELPSVLDALERRPRRILRRVHRQIPVGRVQEIDRRAMLWLARQPGETLAERAGEEQRVLAVAREENFDTLENRVLRSYAELADRNAREYLDRNRTRRLTRRARLVEGYGKRCGRIAQELSRRGVRVAEVGVTPNFVLQQNPLYNRIWDGWIELLDRERVKDELWRWQARSWEEFCALAIVVALTSLSGARLVASAPLWFRDEHWRGRWIEADAPLAVVYLPESGLIAEVQTGVRTDSLSGLGAPLWLRVGAAGETKGFLSRIAVWPIWSPLPGLFEGESEEVLGVLERAAGDGLRGGVVIRPASSHDESEKAHSRGVLALTLGTEGVALRDGLQSITEFVEAFLRGRQA